MPEEVSNSLKLKELEDKVWGIFLKSDGTAFCHEAAFGDTIVVTRTDNTKIYYKGLGWIKARIYEEEVGEK